MNKLQLVSYKLINAKLNLFIKSSEIHAAGEIQFKLVSNSTRNDEFYPAQISKHDHEYEFTLDLSQIGYNEVEQDRLDVFICTKSGEHYQLFFDKFPAVNKASRYSLNEYVINAHQSAVPYVAANNAFCILYGNAIDISKAYATVIESNVTASSINSNDRNLTLRLPRRFVATGGNMYVTAENMKSGKTVILNHTVAETSDEDVPVVIQMDGQWTRNDNYEIYVQVKKGHKLSKYRVGIVEREVERGSIKNYEPIHLDARQSLLPYMSKDGGVSVYSGDMLSVALKTGMSLDKDAICFEDIAVKGEKVIIRVHHQSLAVMKQYNKATYYLQNFKKNLIERIPSESIKTFDDQIIIDVVALFGNNQYELKERWALMLCLEEKAESLEDSMMTEDENVEHEDNGDDFGDGQESVNEVEHTIKACKFTNLSNWVQETSKRYHDLIDVNDGLQVGCYISENNDLMFLVGNDEIYKGTLIKKINSNVSIEDLRIEDTLIHFSLVDSDASNAEEIEIFLTNRKTGVEWGLPTVREGGQQVQVDIQEFIKGNIDTESRWEMGIRLSYPELIEEGKVGKFNEAVAPLYKRYFNIINSGYEIEQDDSDDDDAPSTNVVCPYLTEKNGLSIAIRPEMNLSSERLKTKTKIDQFDMKGALVNVKATVHVEDCDEYQINKVKLKFRNRAILSEIDVAVTQETRTASGSSISFQINLAECNFQSFYWDVYLVLNIDNDEVYVKLKNPTQDIMDAISKKTLSYEYFYNKNVMVYPYITLDKSIAFCYREQASYEKKSFKIKENVSFYIYRMFKSYFDKKDIWLGFEKFVETAQDNGYYFFDYCHRNDKHKNFYYVIKKNSLEYDNLKSKGYKLITHMSMKYMIYLFAARLLISSEAKANIYDIKIQRGKLKAALDHKKFVFLQHGVIAFKKIDNTFKKSKDNSRPSIVDLFVVSSQYEKKIVKDHFGYNDKDLLLTGLCRWDAIEDKVDVNNRQIFLMPTWRTWLEGLSDEQFVQTDYYKNYIQLLENQEFQQLLEKNNMTLNFLLHPKFKDYIDNFVVKSNRINIFKFGEERVNEVLMRSSLLITDYSSVAWDMYYQKKPIIFFQFDAKEQLKYQGSYMDMETELFGDRAFNFEELLNGIREYIATGFEEKEQYAQMRPKYFEYVDQNNSERTYSAIMKNMDLLTAPVKTTKSKNNSLYTKLKSNRAAKKVWRELGKSKLAKRVLMKIKNKVVK